MKKSAPIIFCLSILSLAVLLGCEIILPCDSQIQLPANIDEIVNPTPEQRDFYQNNLCHNILVAVVDTGVDYNHPVLQDNIHFCLDRNHKPTRFGWDFIGRDRWPCPYIGRRTSISCFEMELIDNLIKEDKKLASYLEKKRNIVQEYLFSVWHGTTLAGITVGENKNIGILSYRVVPPNTNRDLWCDYAMKSVENIIHACRRAADDGADIVLITSFIHFEKKDNPCRFEKMIALKKEFEALIRGHPDILYIVGAGNCCGYTYDGSNFKIIDFPSGIIAENFLVVGSVSQDGQVSRFSNIPAGRINSVFLKGRVEACIYPRNMLRVPNEYFRSMPPLLDNLREGNETYKSIASYLGMFMEKSKMTKYGTSVSAAIAAHRCAELWSTHKKWTPGEVIDGLKKCCEKTAIGIYSEVFK